MRSSETLPQCSLNSVPQSADVIIQFACSMLPPHNTPLFILNVTDHGWSSWEPCPHSNEGKFSNLGLLNFGRVHVCSRIYKNYCVYSLFSETNFKKWYNKYLYYPVVELQKKSLNKFVNRVLNAEVYNAKEINLYMQMAMLSNSYSSVQTFKKWNSNVLSKHDNSHVHRRTFEAIRLRLKCLKIKNIGTEF